MSCDGVVEVAPAVHDVAVGSLAEGPCVFRIDRQDEHCGDALLVGVFLALVAAQYVVGNVPAVDVVDQAFDGALAACEDGDLVGVELVFVDHLAYVLADLGVLVGRGAGDAEVLGFLSAGSEAHLMVIDESGHAFVVRHVAP